VLRLEVPVTGTSYWLREAMPAMGSRAEVIVGGGDVALVDWAMDEIATLERTWSRFRSESDLCRLNDAAGRWVDVAPLLLLALDRADALWQATDGRFDPTILHALENAGYDRTFELVGIGAQAQAPVAPVPAAGFGNVAIDLANGRARVPAGIALDLGGIGKGLAADLVADGLIARGAASALVSMGGDLRAAGDAPEGGWPVPVEDPMRPDETRFIHPLRDGGVVTSTTLIRSWDRDGVRMHHIIDPTTGAPARSELVAVVVAGAEAWWAEGVAKAALIAGADEAPTMLQRCAVHGWLFATDGTMREVRGDA
jgi:thiamine biosynthesis lipoprotein